MNQFEDRRKKSVQKKGSFILKHIMLDQYLLGNQHQQNNNVTVNDQIKNNTDSASHTSYFQKIGMDPLHLNQQEYFVKNKFQIHSFLKGGRANSNVIKEGLRRTQKFIFDEVKNVNQMTAKAMVPHIRINKPMILTSRTQKIRNEPKSLIKFMETTSGAQFNIRHNNFSKNRMRKTFFGRAKYMSLQPELARTSVRKQSICPWQAPDDQF